MKHRWKNKQTVLRRRLSCLYVPGHALGTWPGIVTHLSQHIHCATNLSPQLLAQQLAWISWDGSKLPKCPNSLDEATYMCPFWHKFLSHDASKLFFGSTSGNNFDHLASTANISPRNLEVSLTRILPGVFGKPNSCITNWEHLGPNTFSTHFLLSRWKQSWPFMSKAEGYAHASWIYQNPTEKEVGQATLLNTPMICAMVDVPIANSYISCPLWYLIPPWYIRQDAKILWSSARPTLIESVRTTVSDELVLDPTWYDLDHISIGKRDPNMEDSERN